MAPETTLTPADKLAQLFLAGHGKSSIPSPGRLSATTVGDGRKEGKATLFLTRLFSKRRLWIQEVPMTIGSTAVICSECGQLNPAGAMVCSGCESHLFAYCRHCGHPNPRGTARCGQCRVSLHRKATPTHLLYWPIRWRGKWTTLAQFVLLAFAATLGLAWAIGGSKFVEYLSRPQEPSYYIVEQPVHVR